MASPEPIIIISELKQIKYTAGSSACRCVEVEGERDSASEKEKY